MYFPQPAPNGRFLASFCSFFHSLALYVSNTVSTKGTLFTCVCGSFFSVVRCVSEIVRAYATKLSFNVPPSMGFVFRWNVVCVTGFCMHEERPGHVNRTNIDVQRSCLSYSKLCGNRLVAKRNREGRWGKYMFCTLVMAGSIGNHLWNVWFVLNCKLLIITDRIFIEKVTKNKYRRRLASKFTSISCILSQLIRFNIFLWQVISFLQLA